MLNRIPLVMVLAALIAAPVASSARDDDRPEFGWALVSNGSTIAADLDDSERLSGITSDEDHVLFVRFKNDEYLIRDRRTLNRADQVVEPIRKLGLKVHEIASAARDARWNAKRERVRERLERRRDRLDRAIDRADRQGESTRALERERETIGRAIDELGRPSERAVEEDRAWTERRLALKEERRQYIRRVSRDIEELAREAVRHGRAERVK